MKRIYFLSCFIFFAIFSSSAQPNRIWSTYYGGGLLSGTKGLSIVYDSLGFLYIGGQHSNNNINLATTGSFKSSMDGSQEGYLAKFDTLGNRMWATYIGNGLGSSIATITKDPMGGVIVGGSTSGSQNNIGSPGTYRSNFPLSHNGGNADYIIKFNENGQRIWGTYIGFNGDTSTLRITDITTDSSRNIYVCGISGLVGGIHSFPPGSFMPNPPSGDFNGFLIKLTPSGNIIWGTYFGGNEGTGFDHVVCDSENNVYVTGDTYITTGITTPVAMYPYPVNTPVNSIVTKFSSSGVRLWTTYTNGIDLRGGIVVAPDNGFYLLGITDRDTGIATSDVHQVNYADSTDVVLSRWTKDGYKIWSTYYGGQSRELTSMSGAHVNMNLKSASFVNTANNIFLDNENNILIGGSTKSEDQIKIGCTYGTAENKDPIAFMAKFYPNGQIMWGSYFDAPVQSIVSGHQGSVFYLLSNTNIADLSTVGSFQDTITGSAALITKMEGNYVCPELTDSITNDQGLLSISSNQGYHSIQWYFNGNAISGAHDTEYLPTESGTYWVSFKNACDCSYETSSIWFEKGTSIELLNKENLSVVLYPNPVRDFLKVKGSVKKGVAEVQYSITNILGSLVLKSSFPVKENAFEHTIDFRNLSPGVYFLQMKGLNVKKNFRIIKTK